MKVRRVLVAIREAPHERAAIETAARLALQAQAELVGLFIEDIDLLHLAGLPFAREVGAATGISRQLDVAAMERSLRLQASEAQRLLGAVAARARQRWSFQVARGSVVKELTAAAEADCVVAGPHIVLPCDAAESAAWWEREARALLAAPGGAQGFQIVQVADRRELELFFARMR